jgi:hypothetical protein
MREERGSERVWRSRSDVLTHTHPTAWAGPAPPISMSADPSSTPAVWESTDRRDGVGRAGGGGWLGGVVVRRLRAEVAGSDADAPSARAVKVGI